MKKRREHGKKDYFNRYCLEADEDEVLVMIKRDSGLELLRIICMFGIVSMHTFGIFYNSCTGNRMLYGCIINSVFNMGVSVFALITGYFGNKGDIDKIIRIWAEVLLYSFAGMGVSLIFGARFSFLLLIKGIFPVFSKKYWYISCYMVLSLLAVPINRFVDSMKKEQFKSFILMYLFIFSVMPTLLLGFSITSDSGKGPINFLLMYFIGRYICKYYDVAQIKQTKLVEGVLLIVGVEFVLNYILSFWKSKSLGGGLYCPFAADHSVFIILGSVCIFLIFKKCSFFNKQINVISSATFAVYLFEGTVRDVMNHFIDIEKYASNSFLPFLISSYAACIMIICIIAELLRRMTIARLDTKIQIIVKTCLTRIEQRR